MATPVLFVVKMEKKNDIKFMNRFLKVQEWIDRIMEHSYEFYSVFDKATAKMAKAYNMRLRHQTSQKINQ